MSTPESSKSTSPESAEHQHSTGVEIFVNSRAKSVTGKEIAYTDVVKLAFADAFQNPNTLYTVTYRYAEGSKAGGSMVQGDTVKLKKEMQFNVQFSTRS